MPTEPTQLSQLLDQHGDADTLDDESVHGLLTAAAIAPHPGLPDDILALVLGDDLNQVAAPVQHQLQDLLAGQCLAIEYELASADAITLPFQPGLDWQDSPMQSWCVGFMSLVLTQATLFDDLAADRLAELLLPIQTGSGLFVDEPDFTPIYQDTQVLASLLQQIPDILTDFYLAMRVSPD